MYSRHKAFLLTVLLLLSVCAAACASGPTAMPAATTTSTGTNTPPPTETLTPSPTSTTRPANTATATPRPTPTSTPTPTPALTPTLTPTPLLDLFRPVTPIEDVLPGSFQRLHAAPDGALWLMTDQGVARLVDDAWTIYLTGFAGELVGIDAAGRVWVVSEDASEISAWDGASWTDYAAAAGWLPIPLNDEWYRDVGWGQSDGSGRFWLATSQDVRVFDDERWTVFTPKEMGMGEIGPEELFPVLVIEISKSTGDVWVGECDWCGPGPFGGQGVRWFDGLAWHGANSPAAHGCVAAIEEDSAGNVWLGADGVLWQYEPTSGDWTEFAPSEEPPFDYQRYGAIIALAADPFDRLWVTELLCGGASCDAHALYHVRDGVWTLLPRGEEEYYVLELRAVTDAAGTAWLFASPVIYRIAGDVPEPVTNLYVQSVAVDAAGQVWFVARDAGQDVLWTLNTGTEN